MASSSLRAGSISCSMCCQVIDLLSLPKFELRGWLHAAPADGRTWCEYLFVMYGKHVTYYEVDPVVYESEETPAVRNRLAEGALSLDDVRALRPIGCLHLHDVDCADVTERDGAPQLRVGGRSQDLVMRASSAAQRDTWLELLTKACARPPALLCVPCKQLVDLSLVQSTTRRGEVSLLSSDSANESARAGAHAVLAFGHLAVYASADDVGRSPALALVHLDEEDTVCSVVAPGQWEVVRGDGQRLLLACASPDGNEAQQWVRAVLEEMADVSNSSSDASERSGGALEAPRWSWMAASGRRQLSQHSGKHARRALMHEVHTLRSTLVDLTHGVPRVSAAHYSQVLQASGAERDRAREGAVVSNTYDDRHESDNGRESSVTFGDAYRKHSTVGALLCDQGTHVRSARPPPFFSAHGIVADVRQLRGGVIGTEHLPRPELLRARAVVLCTGLSDVWAVRAHYHKQPVLRITAADYLVQSGVLAVAADCGALDAPGGAEDALRTLVDGGVHVVLNLTNATPLLDAPFFFHFASVPVARLAAPPLDRLPVRAYALSGAVAEGALVTFTEVAPAVVSVTPASGHYDEQYGGGCAPGSAVLPVLHAQQQAQQRTSKRRSWLRSSQLANPLATGRTSFTLRTSSTSRTSSRRSLRLAVPPPVARDSFADEDDESSVPPPPPPPDDDELEEMFGLSSPPPAPPPAGAP